MDTANPAAKDAQDLQKEQSESIDSLAQANARLKEQNRRLIDLARSRSASISHFAHELRTPLTSIIGFSEILLSQEKLTDAQLNFCKRIQNSAQQLQTTVNQLSELSRVELPADDGS